MVYCGNWNNGASCGSRCANLNNMPWNVNNNVGFRGAAVTCQPIIK
jgi:hypothetical protein